MGAKEQNTSPPSRIPLPIIPFNDPDMSQAVITFPGIILPVDVVPNSALDKAIMISSPVIVSHTVEFRAVEEHDGRAIYPFPHAYGVLGAVRKKKCKEESVHLHVELMHRVKLSHVSLNSIFTCDQWELLPEEHPAEEEFRMAFFQERIEAIRAIVNSIDEDSLYGEIYIPPNLRNSVLTAENIGIFLDQTAYLLNRFGALERVAKFLRSILAEPNVSRRLDIFIAFLDDIRDKRDMFSDFFKGEEENTSKPPQKKGERVITKKSGEFEKYNQQYLQIKTRLSVETQEKIETALERFQKEEKNQDTKSHLVYLLKLFSLEETRDNTDIAYARAVLDRDHTGLERPKERVLGYIAERAYAKATKDILCIVGPAGVGKTSLGRSIAEALYKKFVRFSVGGLRDEAEIKGHGFTYIHTEPGQIAKGLIKSGSKNPVFLIDEIDKIGKDVRGDPTAALLELFDTEQNNSFFDHSLDVSFDCSRIFFICTANTTKTIPPPLLDRMEVLKLSGYTLYEKLAIAKNNLIPKVCREKGFPLPQGDGRRWFTLSFSDDGILCIIEKHTNESGVRQLERILSTIARRVILRFQEKIYGNLDGIHVTAQNLDLYANKPLIYPERFFEKLPPGCVPMFAVSDTGGYFFYVEVMFERGREQRKIKVTGVRGSETSHDVSNLIEESADVAFDSLMLEGGVLARTPGRSQEEKEYYVHIHVGDSAVPKDGPSAGIPILWALYGLFQNKSIQPNLGATGEIDLKLGTVGAVGGIREKALAAYRAGIKKFIIPEDNARDLDEVPEEIKREIEFLPKRFWWDALLEAFPEDDLIMSYIAKRNS